jgi:hypothetical protein
MNKLHDFSHYSQLQVKPHVDQPWMLRSLQILINPQKQMQKSSIPLKL